MSEEQMGLTVAAGENLPAVGGEITTLVELAIREKVSVDVLERLVALKERAEERNAEAAMAQALNAFQAKCPPIPRVEKADVRKRDGTYAYSYYFAPLEEIIQTIRPFLTEHGLSYTHDSAIVAGQVEVTCTLQHVMGARHTATFRGPVAESGGKNPLQGVGSARSYGRRYTLTDVLGLITEDDDDGKAAGTGGNAALITAEQVKEIKKLLKESGSPEDAFLDWLNASKVEDIPARDYKRAVEALAKKRDKKASS